MKVHNHLQLGMGLLRMHNSLPIMLCCSAHNIHLLCSKLCSRIILVLSLLSLFIYIQICMSKSLLKADNLERLIYVLGCIYKLYVVFVAIFKNISYYTGIMLNAFSDLLCSILCWHNRLVPTYNKHLLITTYN